MQDPSLVVVPYRYKATKLYSEIPITGVGDFTVGRLLNTATRVNSNGNIEVVNANIPRLDYYTTGGVAGCPALLVEPSAQNIAQRSNELNTSPNIVDSTTFSGNIFISPDGTQNAARFTETVANDRHGFYQYQTIASGANTVSIFTKQTGRRYIAFTSDFTGTGATSYFDLQTNSVVTNGSGHTGSVQDYGNGWLRLIVTIGASVSGSKYVIWGGSPSGTTNSYFGDVNISQTFYGLQIETGSVATSYIPTTTGSVTRNADVISVSGAVSGLIGQSEGTIYAEVDVRAFASSVARRIISIRVDGNNLLSLEINDAGTNIDFVAASGGSTVVATTSGLTSGIFKIAVGYNSATNGTVLYVNGVLRDTKTIAIPNLSTAVFGLGVRGDGSAGTQFNDRIRAAALYNSRLDDADLMVLTSPTYYSNVRDMIWDTFVARPSTFSELPGCLQTRHNELITL
jgi:hypothetical protein